ncbi:MAG: hypothetical protein K2Y40_24060, partial [Reyranella sp.]|nr:hypothetical protein [Reyranella sp.]
MGMHVATLSSVSLVALLGAAGVALLTWYHHRAEAGLLGWAAALLLVGVGVLLLGQRGPAASFALRLATDMAFVAGFAAMWMSMRRFNDCTASTVRAASVVAACTAVFALLFTLAWQAGSSVRAPSILFSLFVTGLAAAAAWEAWRGGR